MENLPLSFAQVIGDNVRRLRGQKRMDDVAREARILGQNWAVSRGSAIEDGRFKPTRDTLVVLAVAVGRATTGKPLKLEQLIESDRQIEITGKFSMTPTNLTRWVAGLEQVQVDPGPDVSYDDLRTSVISQLTNMRSFSEAETRAANDLGLTPRQFIEASHRLWGHGFIEERDSRAGDNPSPQKLGRITRVLKEEMRKEPIGGDD